MEESSQFATHSWFHVIWTTQLSWPPTDPRGDWHDLRSLYDALDPCPMSRPLPGEWKSLPCPAGAVTLSLPAQQLVAESITELTADDRLAGDTPLAATAVSPHAVQIVISCPPESLHQRVGRLKSRTATLLSFKPELEIGGKGTWARGFWWSRLDTAQLLRSASAFVQAQATAHRDPI